MPVKGSSELSELLFLMGMYYFGLISVGTTYGASLLGRCIHNGISSNKLCCF